MIYCTLACRYFPILNERSPIEIDIEYFFNNAYHLLAKLAISTIDSMQKVFSNPKTMLS